MAYITITPSDLTGYANDLTNHAGELREQLTNIDRLVSEITSGWSGLAEESYYAMYESLKTSLQSFPELVDSLAAATKNAAQLFSETDQMLQQSYSTDKG